MYMYVHVGCGQASLVHLLNIHVYKVTKVSVVPTVIRCPLPEVVGVASLLTLSGPASPLILHV